MRGSEARRLYNVSLTCDVPGRMLAAQKERHEAEEAVREAFTEIERLLEKHKRTLSHSFLYKRPARREELRNMKAGAVTNEERERGLFSTLAERHLKQLYNFVRREIASRLATGDLPPGGVTAEDTETPPAEEVSTLGDVEVPAVFRNAVIEKYKKLEEADNV